jgi:hypothetical protein
MKKAPKKKSPAKKPASKQGSAKPAWKQFSKKCWKTDLGGDLPEVIILSMTDNEFQEFRKNEAEAMAYLDKLGYFKRKLINLIFADIFPCPSGGDWFVIVTHTSHSTAVVVAWQCAQ